MYFFIFSKGSQKIFTLNPRVLRLEFENVILLLLAGVRIRKREIELVYVSFKGRFRFSAAHLKFVKARIW